MRSLSFGDTCRMISLKKKEREDESQVCGVVYASFLCGWHGTQHDALCPACKLWCKQ